MAYQKKTWTDRQTEHPGRRRLTAAGETDVYDITREEGLVVEEGDALNAQTFNDLEGRIESGLGEKANTVHTHAPTDLTAAVPIDKGGTGATTVAAARNALGLGNTNGALPIANGGTGATTADAARAALGVAYGTAAGTVCQGNDVRLSDARHPHAHNQSASTITTGTFPQCVVGAAEANQTLACLRNIYIAPAGTSAAALPVPVGSLIGVKE